MTSELVDQCEVDLDALLDTRIGEVFDDAYAIGVLSEFAPDDGQV